MMSSVTMPTPVWRITGDPYSRIAAVDRLIELNQGKDRREKPRAALRLLASQTPHRAGVHVEVAGDGSGRFTSRQPPPCLGLLALGEGQLAPEIGPAFERSLQTQKARLEHNLVWRAAKLSCDAPHGKPGLAIVAAHDAHFLFGPQWSG